MRICVEGRKAWQKTYDLKRKASEAHENLMSHRERTRRISNEHARVKALVNDSLWHAVRDAAAAGEPYRESNEIKYLCEATDLIEKL